MTVISQKMFECNIVDCGSFVVFYLRYMGQPLHTLRWHHNKHDGVSNHQPHDWLFNCLFRRRSKKTSKLRITGLCEGNSLVTSEFPAQKARTAEMFPFDGVIMKYWSLNNHGRQDFQMHLKKYKHDFLEFILLIFYSLILKLCQVYRFSLKEQRHPESCVDLSSVEHQGKNFIEISIKIYFYHENTFENIVSHFFKPWYVNWHWNLIITKGDFVML